jgi:hypothetical protein
MSAVIQLRRKSITSLLLTSFVPQRDYDTLLAHYNRLSSNGYSHSIPDIEAIETNQIEVKCVLDFSPEIDSISEYDEFLSQFLISRGRFIHDLVSSNDELRFDLSAMLVVHEELAVFELKMPRMPESLNAAKNFQFCYTVWHPLNRE